MGVRILAWLTAAVCLAASAAGAKLDRPLTVSPGDIAAVAAAPSTCPTFSWAGVDGARSYEIVVYEMRAAEVAAAARGKRPALAVTLPAAASSWTPSADRCLAGAKAYVWFIRALGDEKRVSEWSQGAMFRTPTTASASELRETIALLTGELDRARAATSAPQPGAPRWLPLRLPARRGASSKAQTRAPAQRQPAPAETALRAEIHDEIGAVTYGVYGISDSDADESSGVVGYASAEEGDVRGVSGFSHSPDGTGVFGASNAASGGVGVLGVDSPDSDTDPSAGVAGVTENPNGYAGFFWHFAGGSALAVGDPEVEPFDLTFTVAADGNVWAAGDLGLEGGLEVGGNVVMSGAGVVAFSPSDTPPACDSSLEGAIYYDLSEVWLCVCTKQAGPSYGWRRADDKSDDCAT